MSGYQGKKNIPRITLVGLYHYKGSHFLWDLEEEEEGRKEGRKEEREKEKKDGGLGGRETASLHYMCLFLSFVLLNPEPAAIIERRSMRSHGSALVSECLTHDLRA
ncbi:uncharacterized [Tachysurus ichikawai]